MTIPKINDRLVRSRRNGVRERTVGICIWANGKVCIEQLDTFSVAENYLALAGGETTSEVGGFWGDNRVFNEYNPHLWIM